jgi:hypothetical protein
LKSKEQLQKKLSNFNFITMKKYLLLLFAFTSLAIVSCEKDDDHDDHDGHDHATVVLEIEENLA